MKQLRIYIIYFVAILITYGISINFGYNFNDQFVITNEKDAVTGIKSIPSLFSKPYVELDEFTFGYRPLTKATFALEYSLFGNNPSISHFINLLFYLVFIVLLHHFMKRWFPKLGTLFLVALSLLFITHSTHVEVVASIKNREEILCGIFYLLFGIFYMDLVQQKRHWLFSSALLAAVVILGYTTKPAIVNVIFLPIIHFFLSPSKRHFKLVAGTAVLVFIVILRFNFIISQNIESAFHHMNLYENPIGHIVHLGDKIGFLANIFLQYLKLLVFPFKLKWYYGYSEIAIISWKNILALLSFLILGGLILFGFIKRKGAPIVFFGMSMLLANLLIYSSILSPYSGIISERALFISSIGFCILFTLGYLKLTGYSTSTNISDLRNNWKKLTPLMIVIVGLGVNSFSRTQDWKDLDTLILRDIPKQGKSAHANFNMANAYLGQFSQKRLIRYKEEAINYFQKAIEIDSTYLYSINNLTSIYFNDKDYENALKYATMAIHLGDIDERSVFQLANCYKAMNDVKGEINVYRTAFEDYTDKMYLLTNMAELYFKEKDIYSAFNTNKIIHQLYPESAIPYSNAGAYHLIFTNNKQAVLFFEKSIDFGLRDDKIIDFLNKQYDSEGAIDKKIELREKLNVSSNLIQPLFPQ